MPAFYATWIALLLHFGQESTEWASGKAFENAARRASVSVFWEQAPLKSQLLALARNQRVAILLDRRVDPGRKIDWRSRDLNLEQFLWELGAEQELGVAQIGDLFYYGPRETALSLAQQNQLWARITADSTLPPALRNRLIEPVRWNNSVPFDPVAWLTRDAAAAGIEFVNPEQLPFDWWGPLDWPQMPRYQAYQLLLAGFGMGLELDSDALLIVPLKLPDKLTCEYSLEGLDAAAVKPLAEEFAQLDWQVKGKQLTATGQPVDHARLQRRLALLRRPPKESEGAQVFTLKTNAPRGSILATIAQQLGVKLQYADELRPLLSQRVELDVQRVSIEQLLGETLRDSGLTYRLENGVLELQAK